MAKTYYRKTLGIPSENSQHCIHTKRAFHMPTCQQLFVHYVLNAFEVQQQKQLASGLHVQLIEYLMEAQLILPETIKHYTLLKEYENMIRMNTHKNKTQTIRHLARKYQLHESTVWNLTGRVFPKHTKN